MVTFYAYNLLFVNFALLQKMLIFDEIFVGVLVVILP